MHPTTSDLRRPHARTVAIACVAVSLSSFVPTLPIVAQSASGNAGAAAAPSTSASPAERVYERAAQNYGTLNTIDAQFEQRIHNPLLGRTLASHGRFQQQRPNLVSITFTDPAGDRIVGDGRALWVYLPSSTPGQVLKLPANSDGAMLSNLFGQLLEAPRRAFVISGGEPAPVNGRATHRVQLVPRTEGSAPFQKAVLWIDDRENRPLQVQLLDAQGVERTITILSWSVNSALPKDTFRFTPPAGVKVVRDLPGSNGN